MKILTILTVMFLATFVSACGEEESDTENVSNLQDGTWEGACREDKEDEEGGSLHLVLQDDDDDDDQGGPNFGNYGRETIIFEALTFNRQEALSDDENCASTKLELHMVGTYKAGDSAASKSELDGSTPIDIDLAELYLVPRNAAGVETLNYKVEQDGVVYFDLCTPEAVIDQKMSFSDCPVLAGKEEGGEDGRNGPQIGETWFTIFKATSDVLLFGEEDDTHDGTTKETRHAVLGSDGLRRS